MANDVNPTKRPPRYWENADFWKDGAERVVTAFITGVVGMLTIDVFNAASGISFGDVLLVGGVGAVISTLKALVGATNKNSTTPTSII